MSSCVCLLSLTIVFSRFILGVAGVQTSFLFMADYCSPRCMGHFAWITSRENLVPVLWCFPYMDVVG